MSLTWWIALRIKNAGIVDIAWAGGFSLLAGFYAAASAGYGPRKSLIVLMASIWSIRLAAHLYLRVMGHHPVEDGRYRELRRRWAGRENRNFFYFFQAQALILAALSTPFLLACGNAEPQMSPVEWIAAGIWFAAFIGESIADGQLRRFKTDPAHKGRTCRAGLWLYSRHPNYFFEWIIWCAYFLFALGSPYGVVTVYCPLVMLYFLFGVTGIPLAEEQSLRSRGEEYRQYQRETSAFVPWFRKKPDVD